MVLIYIFSCWSNFSSVTSSPELMTLCSTMSFVASVIFFKYFSLSSFQWLHTFTERCKHTNSEGKKLRRAEQTTHQQQRWKTTREQRIKEANIQTPLSPHTQNKLSTATLKTTTIELLILHFLLIHSGFSSVDLFYFPQETFLESFTQVRLSGADTLSVTLTYIVPPKGSNMFHVALCVCLCLSTHTWSNH